MAEYCEHLVGHTRNQPNQAPDSDREMIETLLQNFKHLQKFSPELIIKGILRHSQYLEAVPIVISPAPKITAALCRNLYKHCTTSSASYTQICIKAKYEDFEKRGKINESIIGTSDCAW